MTHRKQPPMRAPWSFERHIHAHCHSATASNLSQKHPCKSRLGWGWGLCNYLAGAYLSSWRTEQTRVFSENGGTTLCNGRSKQLVSQAGRRTPQQDSSNTQRNRGTATVRWSMAGDLWLDWERRDPAHRDDSRPGTSGRIRMFSDPSNDIRIATVSSIFVSTLYTRTHHTSNRSDVSLAMKPWLVTGTAACTVVMLSS